MAQTKLIQVSFTVLWNLYYSVFLPAVTLKKSRY